MEENLNENWHKETEKTTHVIPVIEEHVQVGKRVVETGRVRIIKTVNEEEAQVETPLLQEEVQVERVPVNQYIEAAPAVRYEGDVMIIPVIQEVVVIEKRLMLVEEIRINKQQIQTNVSQTVTLRKEEVKIERTDTSTVNNENF
ncbi:YsnF/AvaK domain-containing protein [Adhaeribacter radiodurans]|uniref:YsnF/AvaK domain-containing protein n=1 Tax=Adhaeribacter radiodurans TaxID=2745197 RepID=A0A7L7L542_9BACT|nr:YsnF/AvaK domain-containing protein [Adhaeribacter radiodurans]QMU27922.1 YsnF/AvaK domain-containing protein [Adhaeribacter radiodurans]